MQVEFRGVHGISYDAVLQDAKILHATVSEQDCKMALVYTEVLLVVVSVAVKMPFEPRVLGPENSYHLVQVQR